MAMTLWGLVFLFSAGFLGVIYAVVAARVWRGDSELDGDFPPAGWPFGTPSWRGVARAYVAATPGLVLMFVAATAQELLGTETAGGDTALALGGLAVLVGLLLLAAITLFNRPRFLVPPHLRSEPGLLAERRRRR